MRVEVKWHKVTITENGESKVLKNDAKNYILLHNPENLCTPYVVAFNYDEKHKDWQQGHYFSTLDSALVFMFS